MHAFIFFFRLFSIIGYYKILNIVPLLYSKASLVAQKVKRLPAMQETWVWSQGQEHPLEKEMVTHSNTLVWKIPWMKDPGRLQSMWWQRVGHDWATSLVHWWDIKCSNLRALSLRVLNSWTGILLPQLTLFILMLPKAQLGCSSWCSSLF